MPAPIATDLDTLGSLFSAEIERIRPRMIRESLRLWQRTTQRHEPGTAARVFRLVWDADFETSDGVLFPSLVDTTVPLEIETDYGGIPDSSSTKVADSDSSQLREALHRLQHTTAGLITVRKDDPPWEFVVENNGDQSQIRHRLLVRYWKAR